MQWSTFIGELVHRWWPLSLLYQLLQLANRIRRHSATAAVISIFRLTLNTSSASTTFEHHIWLLTFSQSLHNTDTSGLIITVHYLSWWGPHFQWAFEGTINQSINQTHLLGRQLDGAGVYIHIYVYTLKHYHNINSTQLKFIRKYGSQKAKTHTIKQRWQAEK